MLLLFLSSFFSPFAVAVVVIAVIFPISVVHTNNNFFLSDITLHAFINVKKSMNYNPSLQTRPLDE